MSIEVIKMNDESMELTRFNIETATIRSDIKYSLCRKGAYHPKRSNPGDAGIDFFVPKHTWEEKTCELKPGARVLIPSGIKMDIPAGWALVFFNKSGITSKFGLIVGAQVVDHGYKGEIHINVINTNNDNPVYIDEGDKLVQGILLPVGLHQLVETPLEEMYEEGTMLESDRGEGGFGSTGVTAEVIAIVDSEAGKQIDEDWMKEEPENGNEETD